MSKKTLPKISVITINYNVAKHVNKLISSLKIINRFIDEIIVIDNNSIDLKDIQNVEKMILIKNNLNLGFAKAVNQGINRAKSDLLLLLNPDCYLENNSIIDSIEKISTDPKIGAIGGRLKIPNTNKYHFTANRKANFLTGIFEFTNIKKVFPNNIFTNNFWLEKKYFSKSPKEVESLCGAFIIFRKKLNKKLNTFDERFFLYLEDMDFGNKINSLGYKVIFNPKSEIVHIGGESSGSKYKTVLKYWYISRKIYFKKHLNPIGSFILSLVFTIEENILTIFHKVNKTPYA